MRPNLKSIYANQEMRKAATASGTLYSSSSLPHQNKEKESSSNPIPRFFSSESLGKPAVDSKKQGVRDSSATFPRLPQKSPEEDTMRASQTSSSVIPPKSVNKDSSIPTSTLTSSSTTDLPVQPSRVSQSSHPDLVFYPLQWASTPRPMIPPNRFSMVEEDVYRGAYPTLHSFPFLETLNLRGILMLTPEKPTYDLEAFANDEGIEIKHIQMERYKGEVFFAAADITVALQFLLDADHNPVYIHCLDGRHITSMIVLLLRRIRGWDLESSTAEYVRFSSEIQADLSCVMEYAGPISLPLRVASWAPSITEGTSTTPAAKRKQRLGGILVRTPQEESDIPKAAGVPASILDDAKDSHSSSLVPPPSKPSFSLIHTGSPPATSKNTLDVGERRGEKNADEKLDTKVKTEKDLCASKATPRYIPVDISISKGNENTRVAGDYLSSMPAIVDSFGFDIFTTTKDATQDCLKVEEGSSPVFQAVPNLFYYDPLNGNADTTNTGTVPKVSAGKKGERGTRRRQSF